MYKILMDKNTKSYYMAPREIAFHAYSSEGDKEWTKEEKDGAKVVQTDIEDVHELETMLYNAGFFYGYLDGKEVRLKKEFIYYYDRNPNEISYAQWLLTKDAGYLELIKKPYLITLCHIEENTVFFPTVLFSQMEDGSIRPFAEVGKDLGYEAVSAVLAYTDKSRIPMELFRKYDGWQCVRMTFHARCVVNGQFVVE